MNTAHQGMDELIDHLDSNPQILRRTQSHRAQPLPTDWPTRHECENYGECNDWPARRAFIPQGCDQQGRLTPTIKPAEKREFAGLGQDRMPEEWDEDQSESADGEVLAVAVVILLAVAAFWALVKAYGGAA